MIPARSFANSDVGVFGLARSGLSCVVALVAAGARVYAWDEEGRARDTATRPGAVIAPYVEWPWDRVRALVLGPDVSTDRPRPSEVVAAARRAGAEVIGDIELFAREITPDRKQEGRAPVIAITGANGKSTTTALIGHILSSCGHAVEIGGSIGKTVLDLAPPNGRTIYDLEISSFQIDLSPSLVPSITVLTGLAPDRQDDSTDNDVAAIPRLLEQTANEGHIIVCVDDSRSASLFTRLAGRLGPKAVPVSVGKVLGRGIFVLDGVLYDARAQRAAKVMDLSALSRLSGTHDWQSAALAYAATRHVVRDMRAVAGAVASFPGLPNLSSGMKEAS